MDDVKTANRHRAISAGRGVPCSQQAEGRGSTIFLMMNPAPARGLIYSASVRGKPEWQIAATCFADFFGSIGKLPAFHPVCFTEIAGDGQFFLIAFTVGDPAETPRHEAGVRNTEKEIAVFL